MDDTLTLCFENIPKINGTCVCCTSQNGFLVNVMTCTHTTFMEIFTKSKLDPDKLHICAHCHHILKKIELFKRQVEESLALLTDQGGVLKIPKLHDLQQTAIEIVDTTHFEAYNVQIKPVSVKIYPEIPITKAEINTEIKVEHESASDCENDMPLADIKKLRGRTEIERYEGKISTVTLSATEMEEEREKLRNSEGYLKLPFKCENCIVGFDHEVTLKRHMENRHKKINSDLKCNICQSVLGSKSSFKEHKRRHLRRHQCMHCGRWFNHLRSAIQHYDDSHAPPGAAIQATYTCKECGFDTKSNRAYRHHMDKHKQRPECKLCGNAFVNVNGLRVHMYNVHKQTPSRYKCNECDKSYNAKSGLFTHARIAHAAAPAAYCRSCNTHYKTEHALRHHVRTHSSHITENDKKFICDECGARFVLKHSLRIHIGWAHTKTGAHRCEQCSKLFKSGGQLRKHVNFVHEKKRPPKNKICDYCGRAFSTQTILQSHIRTHTGEKPLRCARCPASFAHSGALYTHKKLLHSELQH